MGDLLAYGWVLFYIPSCLVFVQFMWVPSRCFSLGTLNRREMPHLTVSIIRQTPMELARTDLQHLQCINI